MKNPEAKRPRGFALRFAAAAVGVMAGVLYTPGKEVFLSRELIVTGVAAAVALFYLKVSSVWIVLGGAVLYWFLLAPWE